MKERPISICEKQFLLEALWEGKRLDGRGCNEARSLDIVYGLDWGSCQVTLGKTRVLSQVSCQVVEPMFSRPNEGVLQVNVDLTSLAAPKFESGRPSDDTVELNRLLERTLKESRCLDLESLCIVAEEKVWQIRLDISVINHEGNLFDVSSVAGLCALAHFRRPDVTLKGDVVTVHPLSERDPVPLGIHHHPVTTTFGMFQCQSGDTLTVLDPSLLEEEAMLGKMVLGVNGYREICTLHLAGQILVDKALVLRLANLAAEKSKKIVDRIKQSLAADEESRKAKGPRGFAAKNRNNSILHNAAPRSHFDFTRVTPLARSVVQKNKSSDVANSTINSEDGVVDVVPEGVQTIEDDDDSGEDSECEVTDVKTKAQLMEERVTERIELDDDSEEDEVITLEKV
eukprot:TRINITY_DN7750_c0_g1_i1.p1 TRINITY_DN7750_c0_g1~~TRINITY_DN7750_c0_g1_i1.p1  ORF type:complete len:399 (+),score=69.71 TRINITY_DN7750_c0_g1_i1:41-1237(+)